MVVFAVIEDSQTYRRRFRWDLVVGVLLSVPLLTLDIVLVALIRQGKVGGPLIAALVAVLLSISL